MSCNNWNNTGIKRTTVPLQIKWRCCIKIRQIIVTSLFDVGPVLENRYIAKRTSVLSLIYMWVSSKSSQYRLPKRYKILKCTAGFHSEEWALCSPGLKSDMINNILNIPVNLGAGVDVWVKTHSELLSLIPPQADGAGGGGKCTVSLHQHLRRNPCHLIQRYEHYDNTISMMCNNSAAFKKQYQNKRRLKKNTHVFPARRCSACTSWEAAPSRGAVVRNNGSDWADSSLDTALWPGRRRDSGFDGKSRFRIWPRHREGHTAAGCRRGRYLETCEGNMWLDS